MNTASLAGIVVGGVLGLTYGGISYTRETHRATFGSLELRVKGDRRIDVPLWAGVVAIAVGGALPVADRRQR